MWWRREREPRERRIFDASVGDECEAFLAGQLVAFLRHTGGPVPPVAWLNRLVHATSTELILLAGGAADAVQPAAWWRAVSYLSRSLLERARDTGVPVEQLQRELLVPLELELIGDPAAAQIDAADLIRVTLARLYELPELLA